MNSLPPIEDMDEIRQKIFKALDPNDQYSFEALNKELGDKTFAEPTGEPFKFELKFENRSNNPDPEYATDGSSAFDLRAYLKEPYILMGGARQLIPTGLYFEIPENFEIQVRPRSGLAVKSGITVLNSPGTVDSDYRGECSVILINHSNIPYQINPGDRIAQAVFASVYNKNIVKLKKVDKIQDTSKRSTSGFGSTGVH